MTRQTRILVLAGIVAAAVAYVAFLGASSNWQYYLLVDECFAADAPGQDQRLRVSGMVAQGSLQISPDRRNASFYLKGNAHQMAVTCPGPLPDNLAEGIEVVVEGSIQQYGVLQGSRVITRCASKYARKQTSPGPE